MVCRRPVRISDDGGGEGVNRHDGLSGWEGDPVERGWLERVGEGRVEAIWSGVEVGTVERKISDTRDLPTRLEGLRDSCPPTQRVPIRCDGPRSERKVTLPSEAEVLPSGVTPPVWDVFRRGTTPPWPLNKDWLS